MVRGRLGLAPGLTEESRVQFPRTSSSSAFALSMSIARIAPEDCSVLRGLPWKSRKPPYWYSDQSSGLSSTKALTTSPSTPSTSTRPRFVGGSSAL